MKTNKTNLCPAGEWAGKLFHPPYKKSPYPKNEQRQ